MEKRIFLAILVSIGMLWLWAAIAPKLFPELAKKPEAEQTGPAAAGTKTASDTTAKETAATSSSPAPAALAPALPPATVSPAAAPVPVAASKAQRTVVDTPEFTAVFSNRGAQLISFKLKGYVQKGSRSPVDLVKTRQTTRTDYPFQIVSSDKGLNDRLNSALYVVGERNDQGHRVLEFTYSDGRVTASKSFRFATGEPYLFDFKVAVTPPVPYRVQIGPGIRTLGPEEQDTQVITTGNGVLQRGGKFKIIPREKALSVEAFPAMEYVGIEDNYFLSVIRPKGGGEGVLQRVAFFDAKTKARRDDLYAGVNAANGVVEAQSFFGPKETNLLDRYNMGEALQFGWFGLIARFFLEALVWLNQYTKNYGFAIIVLTILIKIVLYPLQHKSIVSMKKMQKVQPKMEVIKARYKKHRTDAEQRQKMNVEMMQLYQKEGINPMAGCLPLILQLPILWGFYNLLSRAIELRNAPFMLWIRDLSEKDPTYVLPILMTATMFIQTYITPSTGDPTQRRIFLIMPLVFGFMFKDFPSGLVLYWLVQNVLTIIQQMIMNKWWKDHPDDDDDKNGDKK